MAQVKFVQEDLREAMFDVAGQDIMTADKVTLRMNAVVTYRVIDARAAVSTVDDVRQALYREAQLALRAVVGARELDTFLMEKDGVASELADMVRARAQTLGVDHYGCHRGGRGIRDCRTEEQCAGRRALRFRRRAFEENSAAGQGRSRGTDDGVQTPADARSGVRGRRRQGEKAVGLEGQDGSSEFVGDLVRAMPQGNAGAGPAGRQARRR